MTDKKTFVATVAFLGMPNVGKSTLLNALIGVKIAPTTRKPQTTRRIIRGIRTRGNYQHIYFDTPGLVRQTSGLDRFMAEQINYALTNVAQIVFILDALTALDRQSDFLKRVYQESRSNKQTLIIAINKIDALKDKGSLLALIGKIAESCPDCEIVPISAMALDGLQDLQKTIDKHAAEGDFLFSEELFTDASERDIVAELVREKAMLELSEELPYRIAVTVDHFDESRREETQKPLVTIEAIIHVERPSQKAIVIGNKGATIKTIGMRARKDIEFLLNCQVMLTLFVRVEADWTKSSKGLRKLGF
jgi:GTP-binding protein Era